MYVFIPFILYLYILNNAYIIRSKFNECERYSDNAKKQYILPNPSQFYVIKSITANSFIKSVVIIPVCSKNRYRREVIRKTWAKNVQKINYKTIFYMGYSDVYNYTDENDIIQFSFIDSYFNLTLSTILIYHWIKGIIDYFDYIIKVDSDVYPNLQLIDLFVNLNKSNNRTIYGYYYPQMKTNRNKTNPNYIPHEIYPFNNIPQFVAGNFYILPKFKRCNNFVQTMNLSSNKLIYREDIQFGLYLNKNSISIEKINNYYKRKMQFRDCKNYIFHLAVHGIDIRTMYYIDSTCL